MQPPSHSTHPQAGKTVSCCFEWPFEVEQSSKGKLCSGRVGKALALGAIMRPRCQDTRQNPV